MLIHMLVGTLLLAAPATAGAQQLDPYELGGFAGAALFDGDVTAADMEVAPQNGLLVGARGGFRFTPLFALEGELDFVPTTAEGSAAGVLVLGARVHGLYRIILPALRKRATSMHFTLGLGASSSSYASADTSGDEQVRVPLESTDFDPLVHAGVGAVLSPFARLGVRLDVRLLVSPFSDAFLVGGYQVLIGAYTRFGGYPRPPRLPIPPSRTDDDGDLLFGDDDRCPVDAEDMDEFADEDGCPDYDNDEDTVHDFADDCADALEDLNGIDDEDGCPDPDPDADTVVGSADQCPEVPEDKDDFKDADGCPDDDNDEDGIPDEIDQCAESREYWNGFDDADGCADELPADLAAFVGILPSVAFTPRKARLTRKGKKALDGLAKALVAHPGVSVEISAHTGLRGKHDAAVALSQKRADAIEAYLVKKRKISESRITPVGHGPDKALVVFGRELWAVERVELRLIGAIEGGSFPRASDAPPEDAPPEDAPPEDAPSEDAPAEDAPAGDPPAE